MALKSPKIAFCFEWVNSCFYHKIDFRGTVDDFNVIRALNLQLEMQKAGSKHGTGSFFRVIFNFSARKIFPAALAVAAFRSLTAAGAAQF